jgi:hypothetical protein
MYRRRMELELHIRDDEKGQGMMWRDMMRDEELDVNVQ